MKKILNLFLFYNIYQKLIGCEAWQKRYAETFIIPHIKTENKVSLLDFGCGTGNIINFLPDNVSYTGIDYQKNYIDYCINKFPNSNFICASATDDIDLKKIYDIIICEALISNFNNDDAEIVFKNIIKHSNENTKIIISEMNYKIGNSKIENFLLSHERGSNLRGRDDYIKILTKYFNIINITEVDNAYRIPYKKIVFELLCKY